MSNLTRRRFLRQAALSAGAVSLGPWAVPARAQPAGAKLNLAIIGVGGRGHANMMAMAGEQIVALCDVDRSRLETAARLFPQRESMPISASCSTRKKTSTRPW